MNGILINHLIYDANAGSLLNRIVSLCEYPCFNDLERFSGADAFMYALFYYTSASTGSLFSFLCFF